MTYARFQKPKSLPCSCLLKEDSVLVFYAQWTFLFISYSSACLFLFVFHSLFFELNVCALYCLDWSFRNSITFLHESTACEYRFIFSPLYLPSTLSLPFLYFSLYSITLSFSTFYFFLLPHPYKFVYLFYLSSYCINCFIFCCPDFDVSCDITCVTWLQITDTVIQRDNGYRAWVACSHFSL